jgi:hypothetical protein
MAKIVKSISLLLVIQFVYLFSTNFDSYYVQIGCNGLLFPERDYKYSRRRQERGKTDGHVACRCAFPVLLLRQQSFVYRNSKKQQP